MEKLRNVVYLPEDEHKRSQLMAPTVRDSFQELLKGGSKTVNTVSGRNFTVESAEASRGTIFEGAELQVFFPLTIQSRPGVQTSVDILYSFYPEYVIKTTRSAIWCTDVDSTILGGGEKHEEAGTEDLGNIWMMYYFSQEAPSAT